MAFCLSCVVKAMPCYCPQVNMKNWTLHRIKENYLYHSLNVFKYITLFFYMFL